MHKPCPIQCIRSAKESLIQDLPNSADGYLIGENFDHGQQQFGDSERSGNRLGGLWAVVFSAALLMAISGCPVINAASSCIPNGIGRRCGYRLCSDCFSTWRHAGTAATYGN